MVLFLLVVGGAFLAAAGYLFAKYHTVAGVEAELKLLEAEGKADVLTAVAKIRAAL